MQARIRGVKTIFVLGHMRSGSSLLVHILNTNPAILGFGETHRVYASETDLDALIATVHRHFQRLWVSERFVLDKLLRGDFLQKRSLLCSARLRCLLLIRSPDRALPSLLELGLERITNEQEALAYYQKRLGELAQYANDLHSTGRPAFALTYEHLVHRSQRTLWDLTRFLDLAEPLQSRYEKMQATGQEFIGDPSERIQAGRILKQERTYGVTISPSSLEPAWVAYRDCRAELARCCTHSEPIESA